MEDGCDNPFLARNMCNKHYTRWRKNTVNLLEIKNSDVERRFWLRIVKGDLPDDCWQWMGSTTELGYGCFYVQNKKVYAHRYSFYLANGYQAEPWCLHSCDNPNCCNPLHLRAGTPADNVRDKVIRGRLNSARGSQIGTSKLLEWDVSVIKILCKERQYRNLIKERFQISDSTISHIRIGKRWQHVQPNIEAAKEVVDGW